MTDKQVLCSECGMWFGIGQFPFCPHGQPVAHHPFVPYLDEHISKDGPVLVTSHYHRKKLLRANNADFKGRKVGMPGCEV